MANINKEGCDKRIALILGHPDAAPERYCRRLADAYRTGARMAGHDVRLVDVAALDFEVLRSQSDWFEKPVAPDIGSAQETIQWAQHLVLIYPLWLGTMPALLKAFLEQVMRPGFALEGDQGGNGNPRGRLQGKSARVVVTMGMPAIAYRWFYRAHSVKSLERNILRFVGIKPVRATFIGMVASTNNHRRETWLTRLESLGKAGN